MIVRSTKGLTFDDVLLVPKRSPVNSRNDVDTSTRLTPSIHLRVPIVSANMDRVTEYRMAIAMARAGGIGMIHRFMTIEQQVNQVKRVKRAEGFIVEQPYSISVKASVDEARRLLHEHRLEKLPVLDASGKLVGLVTAQDIVKFNCHPNATKDSKGRLRVGAAIGVKSTDMERAEALLAAGVVLLRRIYGCDLVARLADRAPPPLHYGQSVTPRGTSAAWRKYRPVYFKRPYKERYSLQAASIDRGRYFCREALAFIF